VRPLPPAKKAMTFDPGDPFSGNAEIAIAFIAAKVHMNSVDRWPDDFALR